MAEVSSGEVWLWKSFASGQSAVEGGLGVGASTSKEVPADKRSIILEGTIHRIGLTVASWSTDGDNWTEVAQSGIYVRKVEDLTPFLEGRDEIRRASEANHPGGGVEWNHHASPVQHQLQGRFGAGGVNVDNNADVHWYSTNEEMVVQLPSQMLQLRQPLSLQPIGKKLLVTSRGLGSTKVHPFGSRSSLT